MYTLQPLNSTTHTAASYNQRATEEQQRQEGAVTNLQESKARASGVKHLNSKHEALKKKKKKFQSHRKRKKKILAGCTWLISVILAT
jgi:hypothetical protein